MEKLEVIIRNFCKTNSGKEEIDFNLFQFPESLFQQYAEKHTFNQFKG